MSGARSGASETSGARSPGWTVPTRSAWSTRRAISAGSGRPALRNGIVTTRGRRPPPGTPSVATSQGWWTPARTTASGAMASRVPTTSGALPSYRRRSAAAAAGSPDGSTRPARAARQQGAAPPVRPADGDAVDLEDAVGVGGAPGLVELDDRDIGVAGERPGEQAGRGRRFVLGLAPKARDDRDDGAGPGLRRDRDRGHPGQLPFVLASSRCSTWRARSMRSPRTAPSSARWSA